MNALNTAYNSLQNPLGYGLRKKGEPDRSAMPLSWDERRQRAAERMSELEKAVKSGTITKSQARAEVVKIGIAPTTTSTPWLFY